MNACKKQEEWVRDVDTRDGKTKAVMQAMQQK